MGFESTWGLNRRVPTTSSATGFLISADLVATSLHVIDRSRSITLHLSDGTRMTATMLGTDRNKDLAILKMQKPTTLRFLRVASDTVGLGAEVFTIGFPQPELMGVEPYLARLMDIGALRAGQVVTGTSVQAKARAVTDAVVRIEAR